MRRCCIAILFAASLTQVHGQPVSRASMPLPPTAQAQVVVDDALINGRHSRILRFEVESSEPELLAFYRRQFGERHVEHRARDARVIAARQGDCFITVQLKPLPGGSMQGTIMSTLLTGELEGSAVTQQTRSWLPAQTAVLSTLQSDDAGKRSLTLVGVNAASVQANRDALVETLQAQGFRLVKEDPIGAAPRTSLSLLFASRGEEASLLLADAGAYRSLLVQRTREAK
jgi:hypothetical protein